MIDYVEIFWKDEVIAWAIWDRNPFQLWIMNKRGFLYFNEDTTKEELIKFLKSRVFPNHHDKKTRKALKELGLEEYNYIEILKKTQGKLPNNPLDYLSVRICEKD